MARIRRLLPATVAAVLFLSLIFVNGSIAEPLGLGLLASFGVSSGQSESSTQDAVFQFGLPVTVMNKDTQPVPMTVQGNSADPLTATIDGRVSTQDVNDPSVQRFGNDVEFSIVSASSFGSEDKDIPVPAGKRLIIRYVSGVFDGSLDANGEITILTMTGGEPVHSTIPRHRSGRDRIPGETFWC